MISKIIFKQQKNKYIKACKNAEEADMLNECMKLNKESIELVKKGQPK